MRVFTVLLVASCYGNRDKLRPDGPPRLVYRLYLTYVNYNNRRIRTHESDFEVTVRRLGKIIQRIFFLLNQEPAFAEPLGNGLERLVSQGLLYFDRKLSRYDFCTVYFVLPRLTAPGSPRMTLTLPLS